MCLKVYRVHLDTTIPHMHEKKNAMLKLNNKFTHKIRLF